MSADIAIDKMLELLKEKDYALFLVTADLFRENYPEHSATLYEALETRFDYFGQSGQGDPKERAVLLLNDDKYDEFVVAYHLFKVTYPERGDEIDNDLSDLYFFFEDAPHDETRELLSALYAKSNEGNTLEGLKSLPDEQVFGMELSNKARTQFLVFMPDPSEKGRKRYSGFAKDGFFNHFTQDDYASLIEDAWEQGFRYPTSGNLERLSTSKEWASGSQVVLLIQQHNNGKLGFSEALNEMSRIRR